MSGERRPSSEIEKLLKAAGLRRTPVRVEVLELLSKSPEPLDAAQILKELPAYTDAVTVYRTLNTFTAKKILHRVRSEDRSWLYAYGSPEEKQQHHHPHFVCDDCGKVECLSESKVPAGFIKSLAVKRAYKISYPEVVLHGVCPRCR